MAKHIALLAVFVAGCVVLSGVMAVTTTSTTTTSTTPAPGEIDDEEDGDQYTPFEGERFDGFDWKMCKLLDDRERGNVVISPIGVKIVLAMLYEGALGATAREIKETLQLPASRFAVRQRFNTILKSLQASRPDEYVLDIGTKVYVDTSVTPREKFAKILKTYYNSCIEQIDFSNSVEASAKINSWIEAVTNGHIQNLVSEADSMSSKVMLLLNAIFFKGLWRFPFNPKDTSTARFNLTPTKSVPVQFMKTTNNFYIFDSPTYNAKILRLPYMGKKYSMFVVLPNNPTGLKKLLNTITPDGLRHHMWLMEEGKVEVILPKFSFKYTADLSEILREMGIRELFGETAQLHGVVKGSHAPARLYVSDVLQKAGLEVGEQGTTAYGVTEVSVVNKFGENDYVFNATHPFMFYIEDEDSGTVIFIGKVVDPSKMDKISPTSFQPISGPDSPNTNQPPRPKPTNRPNGGSNPRVTPPPRRPFSSESTTKNKQQQQQQQRTTTTPQPSYVRPEQQQQPQQQGSGASNQNKTVNVWSQLYADRTN